MMVNVIKKMIAENAKIMLLDQKRKEENDMARCRDCIHLGVCENILLKLAADTSTTGKCKHFIDKNDVVSKSEVDKLEYTLLGVMHSVDKWLEGDELEKDEVNRAATMREKLLQIIEQLETERDRYKRHYFQHNYDECRAEGIKEFAERLKEKHCERLGYFGGTYRLTGNDIDNLVKEMTEG